MILQCPSPHFLVSFQHARICTPTKRSNFVISDGLFQCNGAFPKGRKGAKGSLLWPFLSMIFSFLNEFCNHSLPNFASQLLSVLMSSVFFHLFQMWANENTHTLNVINQFGNCQHVKPKDTHPKIDVLNSQLNSQRASSFVCERAMLMKGLISPPNWKFHGFTMAESQRVEEVYPNLLSSRPFPLWSDHKQVPCQSDHGVHDFFPVFLHMLMLIWIHFLTCLASHWSVRRKWHHFVALNNPWILP